MVLQLTWIRKLVLLKRDRNKPLHTASATVRSGTDVVKTVEEQVAFDSALRYVPIYALGNLCIGT